MWIHFNTKNESFIDLYKQLKFEGVLNPFYLTLYDKDLLDVDPHDDNLQTVQKYKILLECARNPWYFFREVLRVSDIGSPNFTERFPINKGTLAILYTSLNGINHIVRLPRNHYRELTYKCLFVYLFLFGPNSNKIDMHNIYGEENTATINFIRDIISSLPEYFHTLTKFTENLRSFTNIKLKSSLSKVKIPNSYYEAEVIGRGLSANMHYYHLADHNKYIHKLFHSSIPKFMGDKDLHRRLGSDLSYSIMISSFINEDEDAESSRFVERMIYNSLKWDSKFFDMEIRGLEVFLHRHAPNNFMYIEYDFLQLGKDKDWFDMQCKLMNMDQGKINRELLLVR